MPGSSPPPEGQPIPPTGSSPPSKDLAPSFGSSDLVPSSGKRLTKGEAHLLSFLNADALGQSFKRNHFDAEQVSSLIQKHCLDPDPKVSLRGLTLFLQLIDKVAKVNGFVGTSQFTSEQTDGSGTKNTVTGTRQGLLHGPADPDDSEEVDQEEADFLPESGDAPPLGFFTPPRTSGSETRDEEDDPYPFEEDGGECPIP